jgi:circadian clock protein KaiB
MKINKNLIEGNHAATNREIYVFHLYVTGASPNSLRAIENTRKICEKYLPKNYELEIIDVYQQPVIAQRENIIALPLLIKKSPSPERRFIGNISDVKKVVTEIGLHFNATNGNENER